MPSRMNKRKARKDRSEIPFFRYDDRLYWENRTSSEQPSIFSGINRNRIKIRLDLVTKF